MGCVGGDRYAARKRRRGEGGPRRGMLLIEGGRHVGAGEAPEGQCTRNWEKVREEVPGFLGGHEVE